jgi:hypothetical protein
VHSDHQAGTERRCRHCGGSLADRRRGAWFCTRACKQKARRRRQAGRPENFLAGDHGGRRGRHPLSHVTDLEIFAGQVDELRQAVKS